MLQARWAAGGRPVTRPRTTFTTNGSRNRCGVFDRHSDYGGERPRYHHVSRTADLDGWLGAGGGELARQAMDTWPVVGWRTRIRPTCCRRCRPNALPVATSAGLPSPLTDTVVTGHVVPRAISPSGRLGGGELNTPHC